MIRFKTLRLSNVIYFLIILALVVTVVYLSWRLLSGNPIGHQGVQQQNAQDQEEEIIQEDEQMINPAYKSMLAGGFSAVAADGSSGSIFSILWNTFIRRDIRDPKTILTYPMPYLEYSPDLPDNELGEAIEVASNHTNRSGIDRSSSPIDISRLDSEEGKDQEISDEIRIQIDGIQVME